MVGADEDAHDGESVRLPGVAVLGVDGWRGAWVGALPDAAAVLAVPAVDRLDACAAAVGGALRAQARRLSPKNLRRRSG